MADQGRPPDHQRGMTDVEITLIAEDVKKKSQLISLIQPSSIHTLQIPFIINTCLLILIYNMAFIDEVPASVFMLMFLFYVTSFGLMDRTNKRLDALVELLQKQKILE